MSSAQSRAAATWRRLCEQHAITVDEISVRADLLARNCVYSLCCLRASVCASGESDRVQLGGESGDESGVIWVGIEHTRTPRSLKQCRVQAQCRGLESRTKPSPRSIHPPPHITRISWPIYSSKNPRGLRWALADIDITTRRSPPTPIIEDLAVVHIMRVDLKTP